MTTTSADTASPGGARRRASRDRLLADLTVVEPTPRQRRLAALAVCHHNPDRETARMILDALGLLDDDAVRSPRMRAAS